MSTTTTSSSRSVNSPQLCTRTNNCNLDTVAAALTVLNSKVGKLQKDIHTLANEPSNQKHARVKKVTGKSNPGRRERESRNFSHDSTVVLGRVGGGGGGRGNDQELECALSCRHQLEKNRNRALLVAPTRKNRSSSELEGGNKGVSLADDGGASAYNAPKVTPPLRGQKILRKKISRGVQCDMLTGTTEYHIDCVRADKATKNRDEGNVLRDVKLNVPVQKQQEQSTVYPRSSRRADGGPDERQYAGTGRIKEEQQRVRLNDTRMRSAGSGYTGNKSREAAKEKRPTKPKGEDSGCCAYGSEKNDAGESRAANKRKKSSSEEKEKPEISGSGKIKSATRKRDDVEKVAVKIKEGEDTPEPKKSKVNARDDKSPSAGKRDEEVGKTSLASRMKKWKGLMGRNQREEGENPSKGNGKNKIAEKHEINGDVDVMSLLMAGKKKTRNEEVNNGSDKIKTGGKTMSNKSSKNKSFNHHASRDKTLDESSASGGEKVKKSTNASADKQYRRIKKKLVDCTVELNQLVGKVSDLFKSMKTQKE